MNKQINEYRGCSNLVYAEVTTDTAESFETGTVKDLAGLATVSKASEATIDYHYYDNLPLPVASDGRDTITLGVSAIPLEVLADITGQEYDSATNSIIEGERKVKIFALGYVTQKTDGTNVYVWRYKGTFAIPNQDSNTKQNSSDAVGQSLTYTSYLTEHKWETSLGTVNKSGITIADSTTNTVDAAKFFAEVITPDKKSTVLTPIGG